MRRICPAGIMAGAPSSDGSSVTRAWNLYRGDPELTSLAQGSRHNAGGHDDGKTAEMGAAHIEPF
jgi:hypothetical protein